MTTKRINLADVKKVYSGRPGCMCGCKGSYRYSSTVTMAEVTKAAGYAPDHNFANDRQVKKVVETINAGLDSGLATCVEFNSEYVYAEVNGRAFCAYFNL